MAEHDLIDGYRSALQRRLRFKSNVEEIADEVEDHLRSAVENLVRLGSDRDTAQRLTLARFGDPNLVARSFATTTTGGLCMPTRFTRVAGHLAIAAALAWVAVGVFSVFGQTSLVTEFSEVTYLFWAILILFAASATVVALVGLLRRAGAGGGWREWTATVILVLCVFALAAFAWFWPVGGALLTIGALIIVLRARAASLPLGASMWLLVIAFPAGTGLFFGLRLLQVGPVDEYGDYPVGFVAGIVLATVLFAFALARLGRWLAQEEPVDGPDRLVGV